MNKVMCCHIIIPCLKKISSFTERSFNLNQGKGKQKNPTDDKTLNSSMFSLFVPQIKTNIWFMIPLHLVQRDSTERFHQIFFSF